MTDDVKKILAPFKKEGGLWHYPPDLSESKWRGTPIEKRPTLEWREIEKWHDTMLLVGQQRGRSAAFFLLVGRDHQTYPMFMSDSLEMMQTATIARGTVTGHWTVVKKGRNFGLKYLPETEAASE